MVTKVALTYIMAHMDIVIYEKYKPIYGLNFHKYLLENQKRYLDDCLILWTYTIEQLICFKNLINSINGNINFTMDTVNLSYLSWIYYSKEIKSLQQRDSQQRDSKHYLPFSSRHPKYTKNNILFNLARRIRTIVSNLETRNKRLKELKQVLLKTQFPLMQIGNGIEHTKTYQNKYRITTKYVPNTSINLPFITIYNPVNTELYNIIHLGTPLL